MIHVQRTAPPSDLAHLLAKTATELRTRSTKRRDLAALESRSWGAARPVLLQLFHNKCAYCESPLDDLADIEHFRPKRAAMNLDKRIEREHYYWLVFEWTNLLVACRLCSINKKNFFPVEGQRALYGTSVADEKPLLLDPCADEPADHLFFNPDGIVQPLSPRGEVTINVLGLNRADLVEARRFAVTETQDQLSLLTMGTVTADALAQLTNSKLAYSAARRDAVERMSGTLSPGDVHKLQTSASSRSISVAAVDAAAAEAVRDAPEVRQGGFLKSIALENFRAIRNLRVKFNVATPTVESESEPHFTGWVMLLGENAAGKSSILQGIATALVGQRGIEELQSMKLLDRLIRNGENQATVRIETTAQPPLIELQLTRGADPQFLHGGDGYPGLLLAYGPTRIVGSHVVQKQTGLSEDDKRVRNLFDPFAQLTPANDWLRALRENSTEAFDDAGETLRDLLLLDNEQPLSIGSDGNVYVDTGRGPVSIDQLSSGFQSIFSLAIDIMQASADETQLKRYVSGIVLIDEIDAHLHPRWKMEVVGKLRAAFPYIQFIASTHEPLCLRGTTTGEIVLMRRDEETGEVDAVTEGLPSPERMRVDQLLTSPLFGLYMTIDPGVEKKFREYYALLAKPEDSRTHPEQERLAVLKKEIAGHGVLGYTRRDQIAYEIIDEYVARESRMTAALRPDELAKTKRAVLDLWENVTASETGRT
ncbi:MAG TPA: AAA family ATPase [Thermoanaerobaculia bacterium]|jgi:uncharacterized protein (TIGR02646 family)